MRSEIFERITSYISCDFVVAGRWRSRRHNHRPFVLNHNLANNPHIGWQTVSKDETKKDDQIIENNDTTIVAESENAENDATAAVAVEGVDAEVTDDVVVARDGHTRGTKAKSEKRKSGARHL